MEKSNDVMAAKNLSVWTISAAPGGYVDTLLAEVDAASVNRVTVVNGKGTLDFTRQGDGWTTAAEIPEGKLIDSKKVDDLVSRLSRVTMTVPVDRTDKPEYGLATGARVTLTAVKDNQPTTLAYTVGAKLKETYYLKRDDNPFIVSVSTWGVEQAVEKSLADFLKDPPKEGEGDTDGPGQGEAIDPALLEQLGGMSPQMMGMP